MEYKKLLPIIGVIILIFIVFTLDLNKIYEVFSLINPLYSFICFFAIIPIVIMTNIQWQLLLKKQKIKVSFFYSLKNIFIGYFYGFISPGGLGAYTRSLYLEHESKCHLPKCLSNIIIFNTINYISLLFLAAIGAVILSSIFPYLFVFIIILIIIVISLLLFLLKKEKSKIVFTKIIKIRVFAAVKDRLISSLDSFYEDIPRFKDVIIPFIISVIGWFISSAELYFISRLFNIYTPFFYFIFIIIVADVIASIPISIYGLGTREVTLIAIFSFFNVAPENIVSLSLFWFVIIWLTPSIIGAFITYVETKKFYKFSLNEKTAEKFSDYMKKFPELYSYLVSIVKKNIPKNFEKLIILDLGTGPGILYFEINKQIPKAQVIGIDPSDKMLKVANKNIKNNDFKTMRGKAEKIPLKNDSVDIVVCRFSITYWEKPEVGFTEIFRILKPGGKIVLEVLNKDFPKLKLFIIKLHMFINKAGNEVIRYHSESYKTAYNVKQVENFLRNSNFKIIFKEWKKRDWKFIIVGEKSV